MHDKFSNLGEIVDIYLMFFIIITSIFIMPIILKRFNIPGITSVMLAGILIGPYGLGLIDMNEALTIFSEFGAIFLMFLAGMEVDNETLREEFKNSTVVSLFSLVIPAIGGYIIGKLFGLDFIGALLYAAIFSSHSVGIVYSLMNELNLTKSRFGTTALSATIVVDLVSLIVLSVIIKMSTNIQNSDIFYFILMVLLYISGLLLTIPYISKIIFKRCAHLHIKKIHFVLFIILVSILAGELIGLHPIIGAFITGVAVSEALTKEEHDELLNKNLNAIGYGFFIPIFFLTLGMTTDIRVLTDLKNIWLVLATIVGASILKVTSGYFSFKLIGYDKIKSFCGGLLTIPKISASLVAASVGLELGIISREFFVAIVVLSLVSSMVTPIFVKNLVVKYNRAFVE
jgi:Kef-type K+ transport system membrane component KefB